MKLLNVKEVVSVKIFQIEVTEDELDVYESCMRYIYKNFTPDKIEEICGASDDELLGIGKQIAALLRQYSNLKLESDRLG